MSATRHTLEYMTRFKCIADRCEDTCCAGMQILVSDANQKTLAEAVKDEPEQLQKIVTLEEPLHGHRFVLARDEQGACRYLQPDLLCSVIRTHGERAVPDACALFPRNFNVSTDRIEVVASLGCPEAARLCLLHEGATELVPADDAVSSRWPEPAPAREREPYDALYDDVRRAGLGLLEDRAFALRSRLMQLAALADTLSPIFHRGATADAAEVRGVLQRGVAVELKQQVERELVEAGLPGDIVMQTVMALLTGLQQNRSGTRFNTLVTAVMLAYQNVAFARVPQLAEENGPPLWPVLWEVFVERRAALERAFGPFIEHALTRYWVNDWYREPYLRSPSLLAHVFRMLLKGATLKFLLAGHPVIAQLVELKGQRDLEPNEHALLEQALVETVQIFVKHVERDTDLMGVLDEHLAPEKLGIDALTRARLFANAA